MKKMLVVLVVFLFCGFVLGAEPNVSIGGQEVVDIKEAIEDYSPLNESGDVDLEKYKPFVSDIEVKIEKINKYVGPITRFLWGVELTLSWVFVFAFVFWVLLIVLIVAPVSSIFDWGIWWSLLGAGIIATLAMQGFGKDFVVWMEGLMTQWWVGFVVLFVAVIVGVVYRIVFKFVKGWADAEREKQSKEGVTRDRKILRVEAKLIKDSF